jgi:glycosyltransferase involved in cell wall biosynthesis
VSRDVGWLALPLLSHGVRTAAVVHLDGIAFYEPLAHYGPFVDCAIGVSRETARNIPLLCRIPSNRTHEIPYGVRRLAEAEVVDKFARPVRMRRLEVAYIGRLVQAQKRVLDLPPVMGELSKRKVPFRMHLIGSGEDEPRLRADLVRLGVSDLVEWWGWLTPAEVSRRLKHLDALVLPSEFEGLPLVLLEAMGHGVVPVATRIRSGNSELIQNGDNGFLVPVGDAATFADRIEALQRDDFLLRDLGYRAWNTSGTYSVDRMVSSYEKCFSGTDVRAPRPSGRFPVMVSCRSRYPSWLRKLRSRFLGLQAAVLSRTRP